MPRQPWSMEDAWASCIDRRIITASGCWEIAGQKSPRYGKVMVAQKSISLHRFSAAMTKHFDLTSKLRICHTCDNRKCFNPDHLFEGTDSDNIRDSVRKGRQKEIRKTSCANGHSFDEKNTRFSKTGKRICRTCANDRLRLMYSRNNPTAQFRGPIKKSSRFIGVSFDARRELPWRARIKIGDNEKWLGYFATQEDAAHAYDREALRSRV